MPLSLGFFQNCVWGRGFGIHLLLKAFGFPCELASRTVTGVFLEECERSAGVRGIHVTLQTPVGFAGCELGLSSRQCGKCPAQLYTQA